MSEPFDLELRTLAKRFGASHAVSDVNLGIKKGEFISLLGPSGCGKSTTLMMIAGFEDPTEGEILIRGKSVNHLQVEHRNVGIVFQSYALFPHMSVWKNVEYGLKMRHVPGEERKRRVEKILRMVHMFDYASRLPSALSGGQQQRVALARALVIEPDLLLLDEPFSALDRSLREELQREVRALQKSLDITTIFVTHDQDEALLMSDRIAVMQKGRIEQCATPSVLYKRPATHFVASFVGRGTFIPGKVITPAAGKSRFSTGIGDIAVPVENVMAGASHTSAALFVRPENVRATRVGSHAAGSNPSGSNSVGSNDASERAASGKGLSALGTISVLYFQGASSFADIVVPGLDEKILVEVSALSDREDLREGMQVPLFIAEEGVRVYGMHETASA